MDVEIKSFLLMVLGGIIMSSCTTFCVREQTLKSKDNISSGNQIHEDIEDYYPYTVLWKDRDSNYYDTVVFLRNYLLKL